MKQTSVVAPTCVLLLLSACSSAPQSAVVLPAPAPITADTIVRQSAESLTIEFASSASKLSPAALVQLDGAARLYRDAQPVVMIVAGHTDKVGSELPNLLLSARRADTVKRALVDRGVPADRLQLIAFGSAEPSPPIVASRAVVVTWR